MRKGRPVVNRPPSLRSIGYVDLAAAMGVVGSSGLGGSGIGGGSERSRGVKNQGDGTNRAGWGGHYGVL